MTTTLAQLRALVRQDLHDEDAAAYRWTDAVLDRHITRAMNEYSLHAPREQKTTLSTAAGSRDVSVASLANLIEIEAVEWPTGEFPPRRVAWSQWQDTITLDVVNEPNAVEDVNVFWTAMHTLDGTGTTIPQSDQDIVAAGAAAYAALDWTSYSVNRLNTGGDDVWGRYKALADERLRYFRAELQRVGRRNAVRVRRMYSTDAPSVFEQNRVKY
jgi:hypothetical protein